MFIYVANYIIACILFLYCENYDSRRGLSAATSKNTRNAFIIITIIWICMFVFRYKVGTDSWTYNYQIEILKSNKMGLLEYVFDGRDILYRAMIYVVVKWLNLGRIGVYFFDSLLIYIPIMATIRRKSTNVTLTILLYISTLMIYSGYNGTRQAIATAFIMYAYYMGLLNKKYITYILFVLLASGFHMVALFTIPFHLLSKKKISSAPVIITAVLIIFSMIVLKDIWPNVIDFLYDIGQEKLANDYQTLSNRGANILHFVIKAVPLTLAIIFRRKIREVYPTVENEIVIVFFASLFLLMSLKSVIFARITALIDVAYIFMIPKLEIAISPNSRRWFRILVAVLFFAAMVILLYSGDSGLYPYRYIDNLNTTWY